jgi:oligopeptide transport system substrate-binding protein
MTAAAPAISRTVGWITVVCALLCGCGKRENLAESGVRTQTLHVGGKSDPRDLDPHLATDTSEFEIIKALMEGLTEMDPATSQPIPGVAKSWDTSADGLTWTFHLRPDARWSNGDPVTAGDFVAGFRRVLTPSLGAEYVQQLFCLEGAEDFFRGRITDFAKVGARASDAQTLILRLRNPVPYLPALTLLPVWFPAHRPTIAKFDAAGRRGTAWTRPGNFVGNGAFILEAWQPNQHVRVKRSRTYWDREHVTLEAAVFYPVENASTQEAMFRAGQLHVTSNAMPVDKLRAYRADAARAAVVFETPLLATKFFRFNCQRAPLDDARVRRALGMAIDRAQLAQRVMQHDLIAQTFTPPDCAGYTATSGVVHDPAGAKRLLAEAGYPEGRGFPRLEVLFYQTGDSGQPVAEAVQQMWRTVLGIDVGVASQETKTVLDRRRAQDYQILLSEWYGDYLDPTTFLDLWKTGVEHNKTGWGNPEYDRLLAAAGGTAVQAERYELLRGAETILLREAAITPLFHNPSRRLKHPAVQGWRGNLLELHPLRFVSLKR